MVFTMYRRKISVRLSRENCVIIKWIDLKSFECSKIKIMLTSKCKYDIFINNTRLISDACCHVAYVSCYVVLKIIFEVCFLKEKRKFDINNCCIDFFIF